MELIKEIIDHIPNSAYLAILGAGVVSVLLQLTKQWLSLQSDKIITFLLGVFSFLVVSIDYVTQAVAQSPAVLGQRTATIMGVTQLVYRYAVKPGYNVVKDAKEYRARKETTSNTPAVVAPAVAAPAEAPQEFQA